MAGKKNYIEHAIKVKAIESILKVKQDWDWFMVYVEENFDLDDVKSWVEFRTKYNVISKVYALLIKILGIYNGDFIVENILLKDILQVAKHYNGIIEYGVCKNNIETEFGKTLLLIVRMTKLENIDNNTDYIAKYGILTEKNYWSLVDIKTLIECKDVLLQHASEIRLSDWDICVECLKLNLSEIECQYDKEFFNKYGEELFNAAAFSYRLIEPSGGATWEEIYLLDMLKTSIRDNQVQPLFKGWGVQTPPVDEWTEERLEHMLVFFNHPKARFVIETMKYLLFGYVPSRETVMNHCSLLANYIETNGFQDVVQSSSYKIIAMLFGKGELREFLREDAYINLIKKFHKYSAPLDIIRLFNDGIPTTSEQNSIRKVFLNSQYMLIEDVENTSDLLDYLRNTNLAKVIDNYYFEKLREKFAAHIINMADPIVASLFSDYMVFLLCLNQYSEKIDRRILQKEIINIQRLWEDDYFEEQCNNMQKFEYSTTVDTRDVERYNKIAINSPNALVSRLLPFTRDRIINIMERISEHAIIYLCRRVSISPVFPIEEGYINSEKYDVEGLLEKYIERIIDEEGYRFINLLEKETYLIGIHKEYEQRVELCANILVEEAKLYEAVNDKLDGSLIEYSDDLKLAHVTQLFPGLERKIREFSRIIGVVPFKENVDSFMQYKDPSSILREVIAAVYKEADCFDPVLDLFFVYNCMYNVNSVNIRNKCVHGVSFQEGQSLHFALRITLLCVLIIDARINMIEHFEEWG